MMSSQHEVAYFCGVSGGKLWLPNEQLPRLAKNKIINLGCENYIHLGDFNELPVLFANIDKIDNQCFHNEDFNDLRSLLSEPAELFSLAGKALQLDFFLHHHQFCSVCGGKPKFEQETRTMNCPQCGEIYYPQISPCIIVAIQRDGKILLGLHRRHQEKGLYTVLAGFVETGETLEQAVKREVREESGIEVCNIRYFGSQPWAFPSNLMVGFIADYESGEWVADKIELLDVDWFDATNLPAVPPVGTIARALIDHVIGA